VIPLPLHSIGRSDIEALLANGVSEDLWLEYKQQLPDNDSSKKRFLKTITAFANTQGGDLVLGVMETRHAGHKTALPGKAVGLADTTADEAKRFASDLIRTGTDPAVLRYDLHSIEGFEHGPVLVVRVERSLVGPHMVTLGHEDRFFARAPGSTYIMNSAELRRAYALSQSVPELLREFRRRRLALISDPDGPFGIAGQRWVVLHLIPASALEPGPPIDFSLPATDGLVVRLAPMLCGGWNHRYNADGFLSFTAHTEGDEQVVHSYVQLLRTGAVEAATSAMFRDSTNRTPSLPLLAFETTILDSLRTYWEVLTGLGLGEPAYVLLTLLGARGVALADPSGFGSDHLIDRNEIQLPDVAINDHEPDFPSSMKPVFDAVAQSAGFARSSSYAADGQWHAGRR
jgi:hypothetical protein